MRHFFVNMLSALLITACSSDDQDTITPIPKSSEKKITSFVFKADNNEALTTDTPASIDEESKTIGTTGLPFTTDVSKLQPSIVISEKAIITPNSDVSQDFTDAVVYTVTAEDGSETNYTVTANVQELTERDVLIAIYNANPNNTLGWDITSEDISGWDGVTLTDGKVSSLILTDKNLTILPKEISALKDLKTLSLIENAITNITAASINGLNSLENLDLSGNRLTRLPSEINKLIQLKQLNLLLNSLTSIPNEIGDLKNLTYLGLHFNNLTSIPSAIGNLTKLKVLELKDNNISSIPQEVCDLEKTGTTINKDSGVTCQAKTPGAPYGKAGEHTAIRLDEAVDNPPFGFYEYLPTNFDLNSGKKYPLVLFYHGIGEQGNGSEDLNRVLFHGPPKLIKNGKHFDAIVISPQSPNGWFNGGSFLSLFNYLTTKYPIDTKRIYVTGLSAGGGGTWKSLETHDDKIAAIVPVCGASAVGDPSAFLQNTPIWAHHNFADPRVGKGTTINNVNRIANTAASVMTAYPYGNGSNTVADDDYTMYFNLTTKTWSSQKGINQPMQKMAFTLYKNGGHDAWTKTYNNQQVWDWLFAQKLP